MSILVPPLRGHGFNKSQYGLFLIKRCISFCLYMESFHVPLLSQLEQHQRSLFQNGFHYFMDTNHRQVRLHKNFFSSWIQICCTHTVIHLSLSKCWLRFPSCRCCRPTSLRYMSGLPFFSFCFVIQNCASPIALLLAHRPAYPVCAREEVCFAKSPVDLVDCTFPSRHHLCSVRCNSRTLGWWFLPHMYHPITKPATVLLSTFSARALEHCFACRFAVLTFFIHLDLSLSFSCAPSSVLRLSKMAVIKIITVLVCHLLTAELNTIPLVWYFQLCFHLVSCVGPPTVPSAGLSRQNAVLRQFIACLSLPQRCRDLPTSWLSTVWPPPPPW